MAASKLIPPSCFLPRALLPTQKTPSLLHFHLNPFKTPSTLPLKTTHLSTIPTPLPKLSSKTSINEGEEIESPNHHQLYEYSSDFLTVAYPSLKFSNILLFSSTYNVEVIVDEDDTEETLVNRFRREVLRARVLQECRRRRFFETPREKRKRKNREAAKRYRKWRPPPEVLRENEAETSKKKEESDDDDNWELPNIDSPYVS